MKRVFLLITVLVLVLSFAACGRQDETDYSEMDFYDEALGFAFNAPEGYDVDGPDGDGFIYVYATGKNIPLMMVKKYEGGYLLNDFKAQLRRSVTDSLGASFREEQHNNIGGKKVLVLKFTYQEDGYTVNDSRCIYESGGNFYVFTAKEVPSLGGNLNAELDYLMKSFIILE